MTAPATPAARLLERLGAVLERLERLAVVEKPPGLTEPDPDTGERWEWGHVWAHLAEFIPYWLGEVHRILAAPPEEGPVAFGRVKTDPGRVAAIERDRGQPVAELADRMAGQVVELRRMIEELSPEAWRRRGLHQTLGEMDLPGIFEMFLVGHLEDHAAQLDALAAG